jgi:hypothetical protein
MLGLFVNYLADWEIKLAREIASRQREESK